MVEDLRRKYRLEMGSEKRDMMEIEGAALWSNGWSGK